MEQEERIEKRLEALERQTEPIKVTRIELDPGVIEERLAETNKLLRGIAQTQADHGERLDTLERGQQELKQELFAHSTTWLDTLQEHFHDVKAVLDEIGTKQADHSERFDEIKISMNDLKATIATKDDMTELKATQDEQGAKLDQILTLLQQESGE